MNNDFTKYFLLKSSEVDEELVVVEIAVDCSDVHHVDVESEDLQIVSHDQINEYGQEDEDDDSQARDSLKKNIPNSTQIGKDTTKVITEESHNEEKNQGDDKEVDVQGNYLGLSTDDGVDSEGGQKQVQKIHKKYNPPSSLHWVSERISQKSHQAHEDHQLGNKLQDEQSQTAYLDDYEDPGTVVVPDTSEEEETVDEKKNCHHERCGCKPNSSQWGKKSEEDAQDDAVNGQALGSFLEGGKAETKITQQPLELGNSHLLKVFSVS